MTALLAALLLGGPGSASPAEVRSKILAGARKQLVNPARYDGSYRRIAYPMGDVPAEIGVCTDVVIRAFRHAGFDLQKLIHVDAGRVRYPRIGGRRDRNIDHRRVPNQVFWLRRQGAALPVVRPTLDTRARFRPGDVVAWKLDNGLDHVGIVSDRRGASGLPMVIHNIWQTAEEDVLSRWRLVGHFRFPPDRR